MLEVVIKYFILIVSTYYVFMRLLHIKAQKKIQVQHVLFFLIALSVVYISNRYIPPLNAFIIVILLTVFIIDITKVPVNLAITTLIISYSYSYLIFLVSTILVCTAEHFISEIIQKEIYTDLLTVVVISPVQTLLIILTFRIKRLKNGMPFLVEHGSSDIGVCISVTLLAAASFLGINMDNDTVKLIPVVFVLISGLIILAWWRKSLQRKYLDMIRTQEIQSLKDALAEKDAEIRRLRSHNDELAKIIHKDNKLIPALELAVRQYLETAENEPDPAARRAKAKTLLSQIESKAKERTGIIRVYELTSKSLPSTGVPSVDALLSYMLQRAIEYRVDFDVSLSGSVKRLVEDIADERDVNTLLADLTENALLAAKKRASGKVLVNLGIADDCYRIDVFDNGAPFSKETIARLGLERTTTRAGEGGSGIGLMSLFEIIGKYNASFVIEDIFGNTRYTKKVSVCFDQIGQFRVKTKEGGSLEPLTDRSYASRTYKNLPVKK